MASLSINSNFDAGNIEVIQADSPLDIRLNIKKDPFTEGTDNKAHFQWFYFQISNCKNVPLKIAIENASQASFAQGWEEYKTVYSYDRVRWRRVEHCSYDKPKGHFGWNITPEQNYVWFAYFAPYSFERHLEFLAEISATGRVDVRQLGSTLDGRSLDLVTFGQGPANVWIAARQHPGESMAEWFTEGLLRRLVDHDDILTKSLAKAATIRVIPNMNPDGAVRGHLRTNACGANLNREWAPSGAYLAPTLERSPEVYYVLKELEKLGCDFYADIHGDEDIDANFLAGSEGIPGYSAKQEKLFADFKKELLAVSPDFQVAKGYPIDAPGSGNLAWCANQVAKRFGCLAMTLEQPFKDCWNNPQKEEGWSPPRAMQFGAKFLEALAAILEKGLK